MVPAPAADKERSQRAGVDALDHLPLPVIVIAYDDRILVFNRAAEGRLGIPAPEALASRFKDLDLSFQVTGLRAALENVKRTGRPARLEAVVWPRPAGSLSLDISLAPMPDPAGRVTGVLLMIDDERIASLGRAREAVRAEHEASVRAMQAMNDSLAAELEAANEELAVANEELGAANETLEARNQQLEQADLRKNEFVAMLAHELRNPLGAVLSAIHVIRRRQVADPLVTQAVQIADRQVRHQARLLDDLLDVSRIVLGKIELRRQPVDLVSVARQALEAAGLLAENPTHEVRGDFPDAPVVVNGDPMRLEQVVRNLLDNAAKYTQPGGRITVTVEVDGDRAVVRVSDSGVGIAADVLPRVWDLFVQGDASLARSRGGLGIGLTLVRRLVEEHGGEVMARSRGTGRGSEFEVRLPLVASPTPANPEEKTEGARAARRILLVEDGEDARRMLRVALEMDGHRVEEAGDGPSGIELAAAWAPDVVLIDIGLPRIDGYDVARQVRRRLGTSVRLIALTGYGDDEARRLSADAGFDAHLVKPVSIGELTAILASG